MMDVSGWGSESILLPEVGCPQALSHDSPIDSVSLLLPGSHSQLLAEE